MKRCPNCKRTYHDDSLNFCLEDGTSLSLWPDETLVLPGAEQSNLAPTLPAGVSRPPEDAYGSQRAEPTLTVNPHAQAQLHQRGVGPAQAYSAQSYTVARRKRGAALWLIPITAIALLATAAILYLMSGRQSAGNETRSDNSSSRGSETAISSVKTASPTSVPTPTSPEFGFIKGKMAYPSDAIPGVMVACAENIETKETICSQKREGWQEAVTYDLRLPAGNYYVYGKLLPGDDSVGDVRDERVYYTEYMKCGMGANCTSHRRIPLEVRPGETLHGITVGDWWANL